MTIKQKNERISQLLTIPVFDRTQAQVKELYDLLTERRERKEAQKARKKANASA